MTFLSVSPRPREFSSHLRPRGRNPQPTLDSLRQGAREEWQRWRSRQRLMARQETPLRDGSLTRNRGHDHIRPMSTRHGESRGFGDLAPKNTNSAYILITARADRNWSKLNSFQICFSLWRTPGEDKWPSLSPFCILPTSFAIEQITPAPLRATQNLQGCRSLRFPEGCSFCKSSA
jgi:hypothetical protein